MHVTTSRTNVPVVICKIFFMYPTGEKIVIEVKSHTE